MSTSKSPRVTLAIIAAAVMVVLAIVAGLVWFGLTQSVTNEGNQREAELSAAYSNAATRLSKCIVQTTQAAGLVKSQTNAADKIIADAIAARYGDSKTTGAAWLNFLQEAYPDKSVEAISKTYNNTLQIITGCQADYAEMQSVVLDKVRGFDAWRNGNTKVRYFGGSAFPNGNLMVSLPGINLYGQAALEKIRTPVVDAVTSKAYETGEQSLDDPFATK